MNTARTRRSSSSGELGKYVSQDQVREWEKFVYVPVNPNQADAETLQQLPGVNATIVLSN
ncbi:MAG: hypothetical protein U0531_05415 [Dehalococcoidia bacterium]